MLLLNRAMIGSLALRTSCLHPCRTTTNTNYSNANNNNNNNPYHRMTTDGFDVFARLLRSRSSQISWLHTRWVWVCRPGGKPQTSSSSSSRSETHPYPCRLDLRLLETLETQRTAEGTVAWGTLVGAGACGERRRSLVR